jgi:glycosyltransferase involved in cell wall biosynthesis
MGYSIERRPEPITRVTFNPAIHKKVTILLLCIDRYNLTKKYIGDAMNNAGYPFELAISDNGSTDPQIFQWCEEQNPKVYFKNGYNYGTAQSLNRMIEANPSDYYAFLGNDIELPKNWLKYMVENAESIPEHGVIGIDWRGLTYETKTINDTPVWLTTNVFGDMFISQSLRDKIGKFCEDYGTYGLWDSDYSLRATAAGRINFYLHNARSTHFGDDVGSNTEYRKMKDISLAKAKPFFDANRIKYDNGDYYIKP